MSILPEEQFAFRAKHSCEDALCLAIDRWSRAIDHRQTTGAIFCDMSKAFDRVKHQTLMDELHECGVGGKVLLWFKNYLENRSQYVIVGDQSSEKVSCTRGVPQGSVLGPTLFSIYTRKVPSILHAHGVQAQLFADDILFYKAGSDAHDISATLTDALNVLWKWLREKGLILNPEKTQLLYLHSKHHSVPDDAVVTVDGVTLQRVSSAVYLGVCIDEHLNFKKQVDRVEGKVIKKIGAVSRAFAKMSLTCRRAYYLSLIQPDLEYASNAYVSLLAQADMERLIKLSKRAVRAVFNLPYWHHSDPLFLKLQIARIDKRYSLKPLLLHIPMPE